MGIHIGQLLKRMRVTFLCLTMFFVVLLTINVGNSLATSGAEGNDFSYSDMFDVIDHDFWLVFKHGGGTGPYSADYSLATISDDGVLQLAVKTTDNGPELISKPLRISANSVVTASWRIKAHYGNEYFYGSVSAALVDYNTMYDPRGDSVPPYMYYDEADNSAKASYLMQVFYRNYIYNNYDPPVGGNSFGICGSVSGPITERCIASQAVWDTFVTDKVEINIPEGVAKYWEDGKYIGEVKLNPNVDYSALPYLRFWISPYGWYTGHEVDIDSFTIDIKEQNVSPPSSNDTCCSSLDLSTMVLDVPCFRIGTDLFGLSFTYSGGTLFKLESFSALDNSPCATDCCGNYDFATGLISLPCVTAGELSLWATFSLINDDGIFLNLLGYGANNVTEIKEITLDTSQDSKTFFSFMTDDYTDNQNFDVMAEPWCTSPPRLCGHFVSLGQVGLDDVSVADIPASNRFPAEVKCADLAVGDTCIFKSSDDSYTAATITSHLMPNDCTHFITLKYKGLQQSSTSPCSGTTPTVTEPQHAVGDTLWIHQVPQNDPPHYIGSALAIGTDGTIYYEAGGGQTNWDPVQIYAVNKSDGSLKWKSEPLMSWHTNGIGRYNIMVGDNGNVYVASEHKLYSINPSDGSFNWVWEVPKTLPSENGNDVWTYGELGPMALTNDNDIIIKTTGSGAYYRALYRIGNGGTIQWYRFIGAEGTPISIGKDGTIFDFEHDNNGVFLTASNPVNGSLIWSIPGSASSYANNIMIAGNGDVITKTSNDSLDRINPSNGDIVWKVSTGTWHDDKYMDANENIILYDQFTGSYIYNSTNGSLIKGKLSLPHNLAIDSKNQIYGRLSDYNPFLSVTDEDGNVIWQSEKEERTITISDDNIIYMITNNNRIVALKADAGLAHTGWPRFSHDKRNTFNVNKW